MKINAKHLIDRFKRKLFLLILLCTFLPASNFGQTNMTSGDINYSAFSAHYHDSTYCYTNVMFDNNVTVSNSYAGDYIEVQDYSGYVLYSETNSMGDPMWNVSIPITDSDDFSDDEVIGGVLSSTVVSDIYMIIVDNDTLITNGSHAFSVTVPDACSYGNISGRVYIDGDDDCAYDNTIDSAINMMYMNPNPNYTNTPLFNSFIDYTNTGGYYEIRLQESWLNSYTIGINPAYEFIFPNSNCTPISYTSSTLPNNGLDFVLECADVDTWVTAGSGGVHAALPFNMYPAAANIGCEGVDGTLKLVLDPNVTYSAANSTNPADYIDGDTLFWDYTGLNNVSGNYYWNTFNGGIELTPNATVNTGDTLCFELITGVPANDINPNNNERTVCLPVVAAYDPNVKKVIPAGTGAEGFIPVSTPELIYTIHFQNTGTADAINVRVRDTIEAYIDPSSLIILDASHNMTPEWVESNIVDFKFNNIYLPDSASDPAGSQGFVMFKIDMEQGLSEGTEIKNRAHIYFDNNAPVTTEYALNTIEYQSTGGVEQNSNSDISLYPNPTDGIFYYKTNEQVQKMEIYSVDGIKILTTQDKKADLTEYPSGLYIVTIYTDEGVITRKLMKK